MEYKYLELEQYEEYKRYTRQHNTSMLCEDDEYVPGMHPFIDYVYEDKSRYPRARTKYIDNDNDFMIGDSDGLLMDISFKFADTTLFRQAAINYEENLKLGWRGKEAYAGARKGTDEYKAFWEREIERRKKGMTAPCRVNLAGKVMDIRITGDHYNYLNYSRIQRLPNKEEYDRAYLAGNMKGGKIEAFPGFWDGDYWNFKIDEFIAVNGFHLAKAKARRKGFSFKRGSQAANTLNLYRGVTVVFLAYDLGYLTDPGATTYMAKVNLNWLEHNTHWTRGFAKEGIEELMLGYKTSSGGNTIFGWQSKLLSFGTRTNTSAGVGKDAIEIDCEESGAYPNLDEVTRVTMSSTEQGAHQSGTMRWYGTAGTKGANWAAFSNIFYHPRKVKAVPIENIWDKNARMNVCGFFFPQIWCYEPFMDINGNSLIIKAFKYDYVDKIINGEEETDAENHLMYVGQRANSPEEAFTAGRDNIFTSADLINHTNDARNNPAYRFYRDGMLEYEPGRGVTFKTNAQLQEEGKTTHPYITDVPFNPKKDIQGCIREYHRPYTVDGVVPDNLYAIVYDPVGKDKALKEVTTKNSLNSIHVMMLPNNVSNSAGDILVATYTGRMETMEEVDRICYYLCLYYNAKALAEVDRGETVKNFRIWKALKWLYKDPRAVLDGKYNDNAGYGIVIGNSTEADNAMIYLKDFITEGISRDENNGLMRNFHYIYDVPILQEFLNYYKTGNFDRLSSLRLYPYVRSYHAILKKTSKVKTKVEGHRGFLDELYN